MRSGRAAVAALAALLLAALTAGARPPPPATRPAVSAARASKRSEQFIAESWLPALRGYDWSRVGYKEGELNLPTPKVTFSVKQFGAKGDGKTDDTAAVQSALKAIVARSGVLFFPPGTYLMSQPLLVNASNVVLRGAGVDKTKLLFNQSLTEVYGTNWKVVPCKKDRLNSAWSFGGAFISFSGTKERGKPVVLASIQQADRDSTRLKVNSTARLKAGQWVQLVVDDNSTITESKDEKDYVNCTLVNGGGRRQLRQDSSHLGLSLRQIPQHLRQDPIFAAAWEAAEEAGEDDGITASQAAALEWQYQVVQRPDRVGAAQAAPGTVAAWVYGGNKVESGGPGAINTGAIRHVFRVTAVGNGYIDIDRPLFPRVNLGWRAVLTSYNEKVGRNGVEHMTVSFQNAGLFPGHFKDRGFNAISFSRVSNSWATNVNVENADNGIFVSSTEFVTVKDVKVGTTTPRYLPGDQDQLQGHHAISITGSQGVLVKRFNITSKYFHDLTISQGAFLSVYTSGTGLDINADHHRGGPMANLYSNIDMGLGTRPFQSSGRSDRGAHSGRHGTFWNLRRKSSAALPLPPCDWGPILNFVGNYAGDKCPAMNWLVQPLKPDQPLDLQTAQRNLRRRLKRTAG